MNDTYSELLIKKEVTAKDKMIKVLLIALIALMAVAGILITPLAFIAAIALGIAAYFVFPNLDLEFEYVYVNGELDIDKIMAKMKRKRAKSFELSKMESDIFTIYQNETGFVKRSNLYASTQTFSS